MEKLYSKLRGRILEKFGSQGAFAKAIGLSEQSVSAKLNGKFQFSTDDIIKWCQLLDINREDVGLYFFVPDNFQNGKVDWLDRG